jgi:hypothetical protein
MFDGKDEFFVDVRLCLLVSTSGRAEARSHRGTRRTLSVARSLGIRLARAVQKSESEKSAIGQFGSTGSLYDSSLHGV